MLPRENFRFLELRNAISLLMRITNLPLTNLPSLNKSFAIIKDYSTLGVHYRNLQALVHEQETSNLTLHEAQPSAVLNFEFLVRERVLVNPIMHEQRVLKTF